MEGRQHRLSLQPSAIDDAATWIERHRAVWEAKFDAVDEWLKSSG